MKVLIITNMRPSRQQPYSGIFVINQYRKLNSMPGGPECSLFTMERRFTGPLGSVWKYGLALLRFIPVLFRKYDIVHLHFFYPLVLLVSLYRYFHPRCRSVVTFHGSDIVSHMHTGRSTRFFSRLARQVDCLIAVSRDLGTLVKRKLGLEPHRILCAGVDKSTFYKMDTGTKKYDFIYVGSMTRLKGADLFIDAVRLLDDKRIRICVAGAGPYMDAFRKLKDEFHVEILERQDQSQLRTLFNQSRFLVMPSRQESFGLVVTEAMYCGTPVIASHLGGIPEQIDEGHNGFFIHELTPAAVAQAMERALALPGSAYETLARNAGASNSAYSLEHVCSETLDIYKELVDTGSLKTQVDTGTRLKNSPTTGN